MPRAAISFGSVEQRSKPLDGSRLINLYPEAPPLGSRAPALMLGSQGPQKAVLYGTPGMALKYTAGMGPIREMRDALGYLWVLSGQSLWRIAPDGTKVLCTGDVIEPSGEALMTDNGLQLVILANGKTYTVGGTTARAELRITGGTFAAGTNQVTSLTVDGVEVLSGPLDWNDTNAATAAALAADINGFTSGYTATASGETVTIVVPNPGIGGNDLDVVATVTGDVTFNHLTTTTGGGAPVSTEVKRVTSEAYPEEGASSLAFIDGYIVFTKAGSSQWFISDLYNATNIDALDFATAESNPTDLVRVLALKSEIWLFKQRGYEVWTHTGESPFPFSRIRGAVGEHGAASMKSPCVVDDAPFWLGDDGIVYRAQGYNALRISEHWLEQELAGHDLSDAWAMTYADGGHVFYVLTVPSVDRTYCYDVAMGRWHLRQSGTSVEPVKWDVQCLVRFTGNNLAGVDTGRVGHLSIDHYTDFGQPIRREGRTPPIYPDGARARCSEIELECELGVGIGIGQGSDPVVMLRHSDDGCVSFSNERRMSIGRQGARINRATAKRLGQFRQRTFSFAISDPVKVCFFGFRVEIL